VAPEEPVSLQLRPATAARAATARLRPRQHPAATVASAPAATTWVPRVAAMPAVVTADRPAPAATAARAATTRRPRVATVVAAAWGTGSRGFRPMINRANMRAFFGRGGGLKAAALRLGIAAGLVV